MKYVLPLLLIAFSGFAAEPPVVKSKAAKELLKHPEFKKAMEAAPEFTKAILAELDKHAPKAISKAEKDAVYHFVRRDGAFSGVPIYHSDSKDWPQHAVKFFDGWSLAQIKDVYMPGSRGPTNEAYDSTISGKDVYGVPVRIYGNVNMAFYNTVLGEHTGWLEFFLDANDGKVVALSGSGTGVKLVRRYVTPHGKKLGYK